MTPTFQGEMQLAGWAESHTSGAKLTFWLPESADLEVFRGMTARKGHRAGQRFMAVLVEVGDDEMPVPQPVVQQPTAPAPKPKGGELARLAGRWCGDEMFRHWLGVDTAEDAAENVRMACGVMSRAELDHDADAAQTFHRLYREPFRQYCRDAGIEL
jgi:hypothetical protein